MLELDALFLAFLEERYDRLDSGMQAAFQRLLREDDPRLFHWLFETPAETPPQYRELARLLRGQ